MGTLASIVNGEKASDVRSKLNTTINTVNTLSDDLAILDGSVSTNTANIANLEDEIPQGLPGVIGVQGYVAKVTNSLINIYAGTALIKRADGTLVEKGWADSLNYPINIPTNELRWVVLEWDVGETNLVVNLLKTLPVTLESFEQIVVIGRAWDEDGVVTVSNKHISVSRDGTVSRSNAWVRKAKNVSVQVQVSSLNSNHLATTEGELFRWPIVSSLTKNPNHIHLAAENTNIDRMWESAQSQTYAYTVLTDNGANNATDINTIADYYDNAGVLTLVPNNNFSTHRLGIYAVSNELVWFRGQNVYGSVNYALLSYSSENFILPTWAKDFGQITILAVVILKRGTRDFNLSANCRIVQLETNQ